MNDISVANHMGKKAKMNKKKVKNNVVNKEVKSDEANEVEMEDLAEAESVDSGCIPDSSSDVAADLTGTAQVGSGVELVCY